MSKTRDMTNPHLEEIDITKKLAAPNSISASAAVAEPSIVTADPFDPINLGISIDYATTINAQTSSKPFELRKPNDQEFFRTSPHDYQRLVVGAIADKQDMGRVYIVSGAVLKDVTLRFPKSARAVKLVLTVTLMGTTLLWPVPEAEDRGGQWNSSQREASDSGLSKWTNMAAGRGRYDVTMVDNPKTVDWNAFPPFRDVLRQACADRFIDSLNHPLLRKLAGNNE